ncbi:TldD/PmbA family protein, partial [Acidobacteriota bacterium]
MSHDQRIIKTRVSMTDSSGHILLATSEGKVVEDFQPMTTLRVSCTAEQGKRREENSTSLGVRSGFEFYTPEKLDEAGETAARRTIVLLDATQPPAGEYPVVLAPGLSGILLHEAIGHGMEADFNRKGISVYADRIGKPIAPKFVTIVDDGTNLNSRGSINIDDEGTVSK